ncbi:helix-turn-helix domain-containing protein [Subtercola sp. RTI3]|uniref:ArsR/SmtB family transcription factor n=1 Tax=Subtercola sp. RTI3 TaxID=3048639 RepID=UPI002B23694F|nr:helix-turn-helix domain-containing protein [Subtercola sp. RTI3]MEA9984615.1 helix-turn-helix domain-containing protein [Subtercola sp. RTI3]
MNSAFSEVALVFQATPARLAVLASLSVDGPQTRGQLIERLGLTVGSLQHHLVALRELGLIAAVPLEEPDHYHRTEYRIDSTKLAEIYQTLGLSLGLDAR